MQNWTWRSCEETKSEKKEYSEFSILLNNALRDFEETKKGLVDTNRTKIKTENEVSILQTKISGYQGKIKELGLQLIHWVAKG